MSQEKLLLNLKHPVELPNFKSSNKVILPLMFVDELVAEWEWLGSSSVEVYRGATTAWS